MEENNEILRMVSQALINNYEIQKEIIKLLKITTVPNPMFQDVNRLLTMNAHLLNELNKLIPAE